MKNGNQRMIKRRWKRGKILKKKEKSFKKYFCFLKITPFIATHTHTHKTTKTSIKRQTNTSSHRRQTAFILKKSFIIKFLLNFFSICVQRPALTSVFVLGAVQMVQNHFQRTPDKSVCLCVFVLFSLEAVSV